jgi:hypothetical protein
LTSEHKIKTNRAKARASTGPKTALGRARVARNAFRHGLSLPVYCDPALSQEVETLARQIAGADAGTISLGFARQIAEAQIDLRRVREARHQFLSNIMSDLVSNANVLGRVNPRGRMSPPRIGKMSREKLAACIAPTPQRPPNMAFIVSQEAEKLLAMDRYERRARSRRNSAIRAFDAARSNPAAEAPNRVRWSKIST